MEAELFVPGAQGGKSRERSGDQKERVKERSHPFQVGELAEEE